MLHEKSCGAIVYRKYHGNTEIELPPLPNGKMAAAQSDNPYPNHLFSETEYGKGIHTLKASIGVPPVFIRKECVREQWYRALQEEIQK